MAQMDEYSNNQLKVLKSMIDASKVDYSELMVNVVERSPDNGEWKKVSRPISLKSINYEYNKIILEVALL